MKSPSAPPTSFTAGHRKRNGPVSQNLSSIALPEHTGISCGCRVATEVVLPGKTLARGAGLGTAHHERTVTAAPPTGRSGEGVGE